MDRRGWIILIMCGIGLALTYNSMQTKNKANAEFLKQERARMEIPQGNSLSETPVELTQDSHKIGSAVDPSQPTEKTYTLTSKNEDGDIVNFEFTNYGGGIKQSSLLKETEGLDGKVKINKYGAYPIGSIADDEGDFANYIYPANQIQKTSTSITFNRTGKNGVVIQKKWELFDASEDSHEYRLTLNILVTNNGEETYKLKNLSLISGVNAPLFEKERADLSKWFYYDDDGYEAPGTFGDPFKDGFLWGKAKEIDIRSVSNLEYVGVSNQFYTTIITPTNPGSRVWIKPQVVKLESAEKDLRSFNVGVSFPDQDLVKGANASLKYNIYTGPRKQAEVSKLGAHTNKTMSYGWFGFGAPIMNVGLNWIHDTIGNKIYEPWSWGIAIVLLTLCIRIIIWPLHNKSTRSMKRMGKLQPIMKELKEKYSDDPQKVQQETLKLYKKYKINPIGGCLPMLIQMPIFFAVFGMLTNAVELRGQDFIWVKDLSQQENIWTIPFLNWPLNILPITMAVTMMFQMRMTPATGDPMQRRIFMFLPLVFFIFCYSYASALALYWTVQNIVSILQTWLMKRLPEPELVEAPPEDPNKPRKKGFMEKMAEKLEEAQKQREVVMAAKTGKPMAKPKKQPEAPGTKSANPKKKLPKTGGK